MTATDMAVEQAQGGRIGDGAPALDTQELRDLGLLAENGPRAPERQRDLTRRLPVRSS